MKLSNSNQKSKPVHLRDNTSPALADWFIVILLAAIAFICFDQAFDMRITMLQSSDLLQCLFSGKIFHFYDYILGSTSGANFSNPGEPNVASYNILLYITMAILALPLYLLNLLFRFNNYDVLLNVWGRILFIGLSVFCAQLMTRLARKFTDDPAKAKWTGYFFLSSPLFFYCVIIQNQYDMLAVLITVLALFFYFDKKYYKFSALMSLAVCYKIFPLLVFIPLILLAEKRLGKLFQYISLAVAPYLVTTLVYRIFDPGYQASQALMVKSGYDFFSWVIKAQIGGGASNISIFMVVLILICVIAYYIKPKPADFPASAFTLCAASYGSFFIFIEWHPQWFIIILPFFIFMIFSMKDFRLGVMLEIAVSASYLLASSLKFITFYMMNNSLLVISTSDKFTLSDKPNPIHNFFIAQGYSYVPFISLFAGLLIALLFVAYKDLNSVKTEHTGFGSGIKIERRLLYLRSLTILIYILPPVIYYLSSPIA